ncbi:MAG: hypothetical protein JJ957_07405 [Pseudomonadales bacterium]|nr:hypothetical protein [Pseudomonadales bacterium]MBO6565857.1 hypothetical protein [Pseudomonadales bacterium]MBO6595654.1 hypothetical protein [Pseudomonadales bacterium]MBO6820788.1 hypothetical protein [Pseudomonadales bacterium]
MTNEKNTISDLELAGMVRDLESEMQPHRDLWVGVERRIQEHPQKPWRDQQFWMPYAVAASLVLAVSALVINIVELQQPRPVAQGQLAGLGEIQQEYLQVRNPMVERFTQVNSALDEETRNDLYESLSILDRARRDLEYQVQANPENTRLRSMLIRIHEQELELLKRDFVHSGTSL